MNTYTVTITDFIKRIGEVEVEADCEEDAVSLAEELYMAADVDMSGGYVSDPSFHIESA